MSATSTSRRGTPIGPVREHLRQLADAGATLHWLAEQSRVSPETIMSVLNATRPTVYAATARALLAIDAVPPPSRHVVDPARTIAQVHDLVRSGWTLNRIATAAQVSPHTILDRNMTTGITSATKASVDRAWVRLHGRTGPAPAVHQWLVDAICAMGATEVARGSGASYQAVARLQAAKPVGRDVVLKVALWWVLERQRSNAELEQAA
jgi:lambda repressor-like predicted transcriptional regulator